jgi:hypothetical protein
VGQSTLDGHEDRHAPTPAHLLRLQETDRVCRRQLLERYTQLPRVTKTAQLVERLGLDLADALAREADLPTVRTKRAALKAELKRGRVSITALIAGPPQYAASAKMTELLKALPGHGPVKVARLLDRCRVSPHKTIGGLNERQRAELSRALQAE